MQRANPPKSNPRPARPRGATRRGWRHLGRGQLALTVIGLLSVCALVALGLGAAVFDRGTSSSLGQPTPAYSAANGQLENQLSTKIAANPKDTASMALLANLLANDGQLSEAIPWYEKVLTLDPSDERTRLDFAESLSSGGHDADAELQFQKVIAAQPTNSEAYFYLGELYKGWQPPRTAEAISAYQRVIALAPASYLATKARQTIAQLGGTPIAGTPATPKGGK